MKTIAACMLFALAPVALAPAARAEGPAVSQINGKISVEGGAVGTNAQQSAIGTTQGSITLPLGQSFGLQVDGAVSTAFNSLFGGGGAHLFWRDPTIGLIGPIAAIGGGAGTWNGLYGGEAELYAGVFTVAARAGYANTAMAFGSRNGGFYLGTLTLYPVPDLAFTIEGGQLAGLALGQARIEYQPELMGRRNLSLYASGVAGDLGVYRVTAGIRFYFGSEKSLIRRHREDDPQSIASSALGTPSTLSNPDVCINLGRRRDIYICD
jgi:hypothetical protein